ncbi:glycosyltransferase family 2 protein [Kovacikia minuta CCNUW1]|uniref:glycosyltransferase family 2 protein n=1 Tax=Kovacikia minuta TaxID=2931930 RepID=UPI001CCC5CB7|nr:glycosyltransferase family 2 protein [Kovacikia minuta]UBF29132.1 glycosyltransferase family 2 protein [Kovacikia minuta CCNUW1]
MPSHSYQVAAYITAYEDAEALNACIAAIRIQSYPVRQTVVVDNSHQPLPLSPEHASDESLLVWLQPENIGIAGGLELALEWAHQQHYDFLWTFDQDSVPAPDCLELLLKAYAERTQAGHEIGIVAPRAIDARTGETVKPSLFLGDRFRGFQPPDPTLPYECDAPITSGSLVWLKAAEKIPPPNPDLFIDGIDLDYGLRLRKAGFHHWVIPAALMQHRFGTPLQVQLFGKKKALQLYSPLRYYYICRNQTYLELHHSEGWQRLTCSLRRIKYLLLTLGTILIFDSLKLKKMTACLIGTYHGFSGQLGKTWQ